MLPILYISILCIIIGSLGFFKSNKNNQSKDDIMALDLSQTEFYKTLNFMLMYGIITFEEYTNLEMKTVGYLKGKMNIRDKRCRKGVNTE